MADLPRFRLLLVEDNPGDAELATEGLSDVHGYEFEVSVVGSLAAARAVLERGSYDATILDLNLPDSSGIDTLRGVRRTGGAGAIVVCSGRADPDLRRAALDEGAQDFIGKDEPKSQLLARSVLYAATRAHADEGHRRFEKIVAANPDAVIVTDEKGTVLLVNDAALELFGVRREDLVGQLLGFSVADGQVSEIDIRRDRVAEMRVVQIDWGGRPGFLASIRDITERRRNERRIEESLREKEVLLGEIHHRVKNNLQVVSSLLDMQSDGIDNPAAVELLRDSRNRVRSMAMIHQALYESGGFAEIDFAGFLDTLVPTLFESYSADPSRITLAIDATGVQLPIKMATPCGLLVNELIANALKHAFPDGRAGEIRVELAKEADQVRLSVSDDGVGLPEGTDPEQTGTLGLQLIGLLVEQLGATMTVERAQPTRFTLRFSAQQ